MNKGVGLELKLNKCLISENKSRPSCPLIPPENSEEKNLLLAKLTQFGHNARSGNLPKNDRISKRTSSAEMCMFFLKLQKTLLSSGFKVDFSERINRWNFVGQSNRSPKALVCTRGLTRKSRLNFEVIPERVSRTNRSKFDALFN